MEAGNQKPKPANKSLGQATLSGFAWTFTSRMGTRLSIFVVGIILARILTPADFGLVAMLYIFFEVSGSLAESGFSQALVREKEITEEDKSTTFFVNLLISLICYFTLWITAPAISAFFEQPQLTLLLRIMGLNIVFNALNIIQGAVLIHTLRFKLLSSIQIASSILAGLLAIYLAVKGLGALSLAIKYVLGSFLLTCFYWIFNPWVPKSFINKNSFNKLFGFGSKLLLSGLLETFFRNIYNLVIGKFFLPSTLGFYHQANQFSNQAISGVVIPLQVVTYPILSKTKDEPDRLKDAFKKIIKTTSFANFPLMIGLAFTAEPLIFVLLGEKWMETVPFLQILCVSGIIMHLTSVNQNLLMVVGRSDLYLKLSILNKVLITISILIGLNYGILGLLVGNVISQYLSLIINMHYTSRFIQYTITNQIKDILPIAFSLIPMGVILFSLLTIDFSSIVIQLVFMILAGISFYGLTAYISKSEALNQILLLLQPRIKFLQKFNFN